MAFQTVAARRKDNKLTNQATGKRWKASKKVECFTFGNPNSDVALRVSVSN